MKKCFLGMVAALAFIGCNNTASDNYLLKGKLSNSTGGMIFLEQLIPGGGNVIDSVTVTPEGEFIFKTKLKEKSFYRLRVSNSSFVTMILDSTQHVKLEGDANDLRNTASTEGSDETLLLIDLTNTTRKSAHKLDSIQRTFEAYINSVKMDQTKIDSMSKVIEAPYTEIANEQNEYIKGLIDKNPSLLVTLIAVQKLDIETYFNYYDKVDKSLFALYPNSPDVDFFHKTVERMRKVAVGNIAPDFSMDTPDGKNIMLSQFKGKYLLMDFWASWCKPCRVESPAMVKMHNKFKDKVEFLSISLDEQKDAWMAAIKTDKLNWTHVSDLSRWENAAARLYAVNSIPYTLILDKEGKIVAKGLRGADLDKKLEELTK